MRHTRLDGFNTIRKQVRVKRINRETMRQNVAKALFLPYPRLVTKPNERLLALVPRQ